ncbi:hypothetical protein [Porphyrobacter sp. AAP60]|uniref:hypothetical protein n=1 Tax=Porphyrobacter sp. AAP60 TaxID=1523423 RepID=UPI0006B9F1D4|nr:hypothetical protein [Porphyrobacter sp. AAP60]
MSIFLHRMIELTAGTLSLVLAFVPALSPAAAVQPAPERAEVETGPPTVSVCPNGAYESGCTVAEMEAAIARTPAAMVLLSKQCLFETEARCWVQASGTISSLERGRPVVWQLTLLSPIDGPAVQMIALFELGGSPRPALIAAAQTEGWFGPPDIVQNSDDGVLIHVPGVTGGNGAGNADVLVLRTRGGWAKPDLESWYDAVNAMLPDGFEIRSRVNFNFREMHASSPVWRTDDGNCCATGGVVQIDFALGQGGGLTVDRIAFDETKPVGRTMYIDAKGSDR